MAITYMTKEGYKKKMEEIAYLETLSVPKYHAPSPRPATKATSRKMPSMTPQKRLRACSR